VIALQAAEVARAAVSREHLALSGLAIPPKLVDLHPLTELMSQLDEAGSAIASHRTYIFSIEQDLTTLTVQLKAAEKFASVPLVPIPADRKRIPSPLVLAVAVGAIGILVIFVLFSPILLRELGLHPTRPVIDSTIDQVNRKTDPTGTHETGNTPPPDTVKNDRHEKSVPRVESGVTPERLESVRRLIRNADIANEKGMYLQAALGYGEAALLYPQELLQVERPERTKVKFLEALKRYQAQVEHSLDKASSEDQKGK
jgi:hypothetical protein